MNRQKAILIGVNLYNNEHIFYELEELRNLCFSCDIEPIDVVVQKSSYFNPKTYIGKGKLEEINLIATAQEVEVLIFNDQLSATQITNIQNHTELIIYDRTYIILEIFKRRAKTKEAILQADIASLQYMLPRLVGLGSNLSRQRGGGNNALHGRGSGETKLELDRRNISDRISLIQKQLKSLTKERLVQRKKRNRSNIPIVSLVGYTNSGKSSLLNALLGYSKHLHKEVFTKNMPFATLQTATRLVRLHNNHEFLLVDTIGFVHKLPLQLIDAFKSTLEEIKESSLILHVVDAANINYHEQVFITNQLLKEIGVTNIPMVFVFNKSDLTSEDFFIPPIYDKAIVVSATNKINLEQLISDIEETLYSSDIITTFLIPYNKGDIVTLLNQESAVKAIKYLPEGTQLTTQINPFLLAKLQEYEQKI